MIPRTSKELKVSQTREDHKKESEWYCDHRIPFTSADSAVSVAGEFNRFLVGKNHILITGERGKNLPICLTDLQGNLLGQGESTMNRMYESVYEIFLSPDGALAAILWHDGIPLR